MTIPYTLRLICVCGAAFTILFAVAGFVAALLTPMALRAADRMRAEAAARLVLGLRLLPGIFAAFVVAAICVPSFLLYEQTANEEEVGAICIALFLVACGMFLRSVIRTVVAWRRSKQGSSDLALVGVLRPRVVVSSSAKSILSPGQLAAAIRHEEAHAKSRDNFKRFLIFFTPGIFPHFGELERAWKRFSEWAADDRAAAGDAERSISLAGALVQIAKLGRMHESAPLVTPFLGAPSELETRVDRLLNAAPLQPGKSYRALYACGVLVVVLTAGASLYPARVQELLERLVH